MPDLIPTRVILKTASVAQAVPSPSYLDIGELALNIRDGSLFYKNEEGSLEYFQSNTSAGIATIPSGQNTLEVNISGLTPAGIVLACVASNDTTLKSVAVVSDLNKFTLYGNSNAAADCKVNYYVIKY